jgi:protein-disulfide isomerase
MSNRFVVVLIACVIGFFGIFLFNKSRSDSPSNGNNTSAKPSNHVLGENQKGVTFIEYGDFQCPACYQYELFMQQIREKYKQDIHFQFRNFPLAQIHQNARAAHRAAEAAHKQNKFWEMHDLLYAKQQDPSTGQATEWAAAANPAPFFEQYAGQLGLNIAQFKQDLASSEVNDIINADIKEAEKIGADSTPTFVINGKKVETNPRNLEGFTKLIDEAIKAQNQ